MQESPSMCSLCRAWTDLDRVVEKSISDEKSRQSTSRTEVSGGIFLYELQATKLSALVQEAVDRAGSATVCTRHIHAHHTQHTVTTLSMHTTHSTQSHKLCTLIVLRARTNPGM